MTQKAIKRAEQQLARLQNRQRELNAAIAMQNARLAEAQKRFEQSRLLAIGEAVDRMVDTGAMSAEALKEILDKHVDRKRDRQLLGLALEEASNEESHAASRTRERN